MAEHFAAEIPRDGVLRAERKLKSPLIKRANIGCLGALHALTNDRTLLLRLFSPDGAILVSVLNLCPTFDQSPLYRDKE